MEKFNPSYYISSKPLFAGLSYNIIRVVEIIPPAYACLICFPLTGLFWFKLENLKPWLPLFWCCNKGRRSGCSVSQRMLIFESQLVSEDLPCPGSAQLGTQESRLVLQYSLGLSYEQEITLKASVLIYSLVYNTCLYYLHLHRDSLAKKLHKEYRSDSRWGLQENVELFTSRWDRLDPESCTQDPSIYS
jgi:hypothetical protein